MSMSKRNLVSNVGYDVPEGVIALLGDGPKGAVITEAVEQVTSDPQKLTQALLARVLSAKKMTKAVRVTTTVPQETRDRIELLSEFTGLSKNQVVGLSLEAHFITARLRPETSRK
jgi:hypothetical protein